MRLNESVITFHHLTSAALARKIKSKREGNVAATWHRDGVVLIESLPSSLLTLERIRPKSVAE